MEYRAARNASAKTEVGQFEQCDGVPRARAILFDLTTLLARGLTTSCPGSLARFAGAAAAQVHRRVDR
eukprot:SAG22_NODE_18163_length_292_cov_0.782383_1_plen_68_part_10